MLIAHARISMQDQNLALQGEALAKAGCEKVFADKVSGTRADWPGLAKALERLREGDTRVVWMLDRLGRSVKHPVDLVGELHKQGVQLRSLTDAIDTATPSGRSLCHVMASLAEMGSKLIVERTRTGLDVARQLGCKGGRKPGMTESKSVRRACGTTGRPNSRRPRASDGGRLLYDAELPLPGGSAWLRAGNDELPALAARASNRPSIRHDRQRGKDRQEKRDHLLQAAFLAHAEAVEDVVRDKPQAFAATQRCQQARATEKPLDNGVRPCPKKRALRQAPPIHARLAGPMTLRCRARAHRHWSCSPACIARRACPRD